MAAELYLAVIVVRDVLMPEYDVVRSARRPGSLSWWQLVVRASSRPVSRPDAQGVSVDDDAVERVIV